MRNISSLDFLVSKNTDYERLNMKYLAVFELHMDDKVIPLSADKKEQGKEFTVTDLHPVYLRATRSKAPEYRTVAVTLWDGFREHTSHTPLYQLVSRRWN